MSDVFKILGAEPRKAARRSVSRGRTTSIRSCAFRLRRFRSGLWILRLCGRDWLSSNGQAILAELGGIGWDAGVCGVCGSMNFRMTLPTTL